MNCRDADELMSAAVDGELDSETLRELEEHLRQCFPCRIEFHLEKITKHVVAKHLRRVQTPESVTHHLFALLALPSSTQWAYPPHTERHRHRRISLSLRSSSVIPVAAGVAILIGGIFFFRSGILRQPQFGDRADVMEAAVANYHAFRQGAMPVQLSSDDPEEVKRFFQGKIDFDVYLPTIAGYQLAGAGITDFKGMKCAHIVYRRDSTFIYLLQLHLEDVLRGVPLALSRSAKGAVERGDWYVAHGKDSCGVVIWGEAHTLCSAVASMRGKDLASLFSEE